MPCCAVQGLDDTLGLAQDSQASEAGSIRFGNVLKGPEHMAAPAAPAGPTGTGTPPAVPTCLQLTGCYCTHAACIGLALPVRTNNPMRIRRCAYTHQRWAGVAWRICLGFGMICLLINANCEHNCELHLDIRSLLCLYTQA